MADTSRAPERIWIDFYPRDWPTERIIYGTMPEPYVEYIREDISLARVAVAYEAAAHYAEDVWEPLHELLPLADKRMNEAAHTGQHEAAERIANGIRALATRAETDALDRLIREAEERGFWAGRSCGGAKAEIDAALAAIRNRGKGDE